MKIKNKLLLLMASVLLVGCEVNTEMKEEEKKEEKLYVEEKEEKKNVSELPEDLYIIKKEKELTIYKDQNEKMYLVEDDYFYEGQEAIARIENSGDLDYEEDLDVKHNIEDVLGVSKEIILIENDEEVEKVMIENNEDKYDVISKSTEFIIARKQKEIEKEKEEISNDREEIKRWEEEAERAIKNIQESYYEDLKWINEVQEMLNYANKRWKVIKDGDEYMIEIDGDEYIEQNIDSIREEYKEKIEKRKIKIVQYKNNELYELDYIIHDGEKNKESKKIIIKEKEEINEEVLSQ